MMQPLALTLPDETATETLATQVASLVIAGDMIRLIGELGAGKSTFARAFIRALGTRSQHIPSPTFTLMQHYDDTRMPVVHMDCYRLSDMGELDYLGLEDDWQQAVFVVEWPPEDLMHRAEKAGTLELQLEAQGEARSVRISAMGSWQNRLKKLEKLCL